MDVSQLDDEHADPGQRHADDFLRRERLVEEQPGQQRNLDEHCAIEEAGLGTVRQYRCVTILPVFTQTCRFIRAIPLS